MRLLRSLSRSRRRVTCEVLKAVRPPGRADAYRGCLRHFGSLILAKSEAGIL